MLDRSSSLKHYWPRNLLLVAFLLLIWLLASLMPIGLTVLPEDWTIFGWPLAFASTAFGVPLVYLLLIGLYAVIMARRDQQVPAADQNSSSDPTEP